MTKRLSAEPRRPKLFRGWLIVLVAFLGDFVHVGMGSAAFGVFLKPMSESLGVGRTALTGAITLRTLASGVSAPVIGPLVDRYGPRPLMVAGALIAGLGFIVVMKVNSLWQFYLVFGVISAVGLTALGNLVSSTTVAKWFVRKRGRALAIATMGNAMGILVVVPLTTLLIAYMGWRNSWATLGILIWVIMIVPAWLFMRRSPEDMGLRPDGDQPEPERTGNPGISLRAGGPPSSYQEPVWTLREAMRTRALWLLVLSFNLVGMAISSVIIHQFAFFTDLGLSKGEASLLVFVNMGSAVVSKAVWGLIVERVPVRYCLIGGFVGRCLGIIAILAMGNASGPYVFALVYGLTGGSYGALQSVAWADYFGRAFLGTIRGVVMPLGLVSSAGGPLFAAYIFDATGSYNIAFTVFAVLFFLAALVMYTAKPPVHPSLAGTKAATERYAP